MHPLRVATAIATVTAITALSSVSMGIGARGTDGSFTAPGFPSPGCIFEYQPGGPSTPIYTHSLLPQMIAGTVGIPVTSTGTPAPQTFVVGEINGTPAEAEIDDLLGDCGLIPQDWTLTNDPDTPPTNANLGEATLDLTVVAGLLPENVNLKVVNTGADMAVMLLMAAEACGLDPNADPSTWRRSQLLTPIGGCIISNSYGTSEQNVALYPPAFVTAVDEVMAGLAQAGVIVLFSAGDEGSGGCTPDDVGRAGQLAPQWIASNPHALSVGGTMWVDPAWNGTLADPDLENYTVGSELMNVAWADFGAGTDCTNTTKSGTGGGISSRYALPDYQAEVADIAPSGQRNKRMIPDVAALAGWPGWAVFLPGSGVVLMRGTSAATPLVAVGLAQVNAMLTARGLSPIDNSGGSMDVHSIFYDPALRSAMTDVTLGTNELFSGLGGWNAQAGYDLTTGWGVPNFTRLGQLLVARAAAQGSGQTPPPVMQQVAMPSSGSCAEVSSELNWAGVGSGGWGVSWAQWPNDGNGGRVCTRMLIYSQGMGRWTIG